MMPSRRSRQLRTDLRASTADGAFFSVMVGAGETYIPAFVLAMGLGEVEAGLIATIPQVVGAILQLASPRAVERLRSHRRWVVACAAVQGLSFLPLMIAAWAGRISLVAAFLLVSVYWGAGMATYPAWNTWMGRLVPLAKRARFFAFRSRIAHAAVLIGLAGGGVLLEFGKTRGFTSHAFLLLFCIAGLSRLLSARFLSLQHETPLRAEDHAVLRVGELIERWWRGTDGRLLFYMLAVQVAVHISGAYFTPFMLKELHLEYLDYMLLIAVSFLAKILATPMLGSLAHRYGTNVILWIGGIGIIPLPALWMISDWTAYLIVVQLLAGSAWAAYELASLLLVFEAIPAKDRTSVLTLFNLGNAVAMVAGSLGGGLLLHRLGEGHRAYMVIFGLSSALRLLTLPLLGRIRTVIVEPVRPATGTLAVRPEAESLDRPILASIPGDAEERDSADRGAHQNVEWVYLALGSNLGDRARILGDAYGRLVREIQATGAEPPRASSLYETSPVGGPADQRPYLNAVVAIKSELTPTELLRRISAIEAEFGRERSVPGAARTLDVDILFIGDRIIDTDGLVVPHPRLHERRFVLEPLAELDSDRRHPMTGKTIGELLRDGVKNGTREEWVVRRATPSEWIGRPR